MRYPRISSASIAVRGIALVKPVQRVMDEAAANIRRNSRPKFLHPANAQASERKCRKRVPELVIDRRRAAADGFLATDRRHLFDVFDETRRTCQRIRDFKLSNVLLPSPGSGLNGFFRLKAQSSRRVDRPFD